MRYKRRSWLAGFSAEMVRRRVYPVIVAYAVIAWAFLQIGEVTFEPLGLPGWVMSGLVVLAIAGFPLVAILSWIFDITPSGIQRDRGPLITEAVTDSSPSIAVLPFTDMSRQQDQGYFCEGVAEAILHALTKIEELHVAARLSSFRFASSQQDVREIGRQLGVNSVLEGSVRKSGDQLRVTAQLVDAHNGYHIWSNTYDRELKDIFAIQDEIATSIAEALLNTLMPVKTVSAKDVAAYEYYLRGRQFLNRFRKTDFKFARQMFRQSIERDDTFALAWAGYADCFSLEAMYADPTPELKKKAREASERALHLAPGLAEVHASAGLAHLVGENFEKAKQELDTAIAINPGLYEAYYYFARVLFHQGDMQAAAKFFEKAASLNSEDYQSRLLRVQILRGAGQLEQAQKEARQGLEVVERHLALHPDDERAWLLGAGSWIALGEIDRAEEWMRKALEIAPDDPIALYNLACNYATLNKVDKALNYLERAADIGTVSRDWMKYDEDLTNLRSNPRFDAILAKVTA